MSNDEEVLERIRYAWIHADRAMEKIQHPSNRALILRVLTGQTGVSSSLVSMVAEATGRTVDWFLTGEEEVQNQEESQVLHLCDQCHGEVYTFPQKVMSLGQRRYLRYRAAFTHKDKDGDELLIYPCEGDIMLSVNEEAVIIPLGTLEAVIDALRVTGLRAVEGEPR